MLLILWTSPVPAMVYLQMSRPWFRRSRSWFASLAAARFDLMYRFPGPYRRLRMYRLQPRRVVVTSLVIRAPHGVLQTLRRKISLRY